MITIQRPNYVLNRMRGRYMSITSIHEGAIKPIMKILCDDPSSDVVSINIHDGIIEAIISETLYNKHFDGAAGYSVNLRDELIILELRTSVTSFTPLYGLIQCMEKCGVTMLVINVGGKIYLGIRAKQFSKFKSVCKEYKN